MLARIARLVEMSRPQAAVFTAIVLLLAVAGALFAMARLSIDHDINKLINPNLPWRLQEQRLDRAFPQNVDVLAVLVEAQTPDETEDATGALAAKLAADKDLFKSVRRPDGGKFFKQNGLLFLSKQNVQDFADQIIAAQPLLGTLAADPSLRGVFDALDLAAQGAAQGATDAKEVNAAFAAVDQASEAALAGRHQRLSWQNLLTGQKPEQNELRRFILTQPILDYGDLQPGARATNAIHDAARELDLTPENGARVRVTGSVALSDAEFATLARGAGFSTALSVALLCLWLLLALRSLPLLAAIVPPDDPGGRAAGLIAGVGRIMARVLTRTWLPALLTLLRPPGERRPVGFVRAAAVDRVLVEHRGRVALAATLLGLASIATLPWLRFDFNPLHLQNPNEEAVSTLSDLMKDPNTTPYTIDILEPSLPQAVALAARVETLPEVSQAVNPPCLFAHHQEQEHPPPPDTTAPLPPTLSPPTTH